MYPYAELDLYYLDENIRFMNQMAKGKPIRLATKSIRSVEIMRYIEERVRRPVGWMTYDAKETYFLWQKGFKQLLIAYPIVDQMALLQLKDAVADVTFMVDSVEHLAALEPLAEAAQQPVQVCIDLNLSSDYRFLYFGTRRSSLDSDLRLTVFLKHIARATHVQVVGAMGYEAQIAGVVDRSDSWLQNQVMPLLKKHSMKAVYAKRQRWIKLIEQQVGQLEFVNGGGSGSVHLTVQDPSVTEVTIGSAFYFPALFSRYKELKLQPAMTFVSQVTRRPSYGTVVVHGGGYIASGATGIDKSPVVLSPKGLTLYPLEGAGEVQTPLKDETGQVRIGDEVRFRHAKAGELLERMSTVRLVRRGVFVKEVATYRGDGGCFL